MRKLPACLADPISNPVRAVGSLPKFYEIIASRQESVKRVSPYQMLAWSYVPPVRCILTREGYVELVGAGYQICVLREFDSY